MLGSRTSVITESFSDYSPAQWIFVSTKIIATEKAFRAMDLVLYLPCTLYTHTKVHRLHTLQENRSKTQVPAHQLLERTQFGFLKTLAISIEKETAIACCI